MYEVCGPSSAQRFVLAGLAAICVAVALWLLIGGGIVIVGSWAARRWTAGNSVRRACLAAALSIYYVRILFTEFVFLRRGVSWTEVFTIVPWMLFIYLFLAIAGGKRTESFGAAAIAGIVLVVGSWMNSHAEYARHAWKQRPANHGRLYTQGLFRFSRHPNYLGDLISFSGLCLISGAWVTAIIPLVMLAGFVFLNIPVLDAHLHDHYGASFDEYARRTRKVIPFVY